MFDNRLFGPFFGVMHTIHAIRNAGSYVCAAYVCAAWAGMSGS